MTHNAADPAQVNNARKNAKIDASVISTSLKNVLETQDGQDVFWWLLVKLGVQKSVVMSFDTPLGTYFNAGRQDFGHWLQAEIESANMEAFCKMLMDNKKRKENSNE